MFQDLLAFLVGLGATDPLGFQAPRAPRVLQGKRVHQERWARKAALVTQAPQDPREARETPAPLVFPGRPAWQEPLVQLDLQDPQDPPGHQDQDLLLDLMTWKALEHPSGPQPAAPMGHRDRPACQDSRGILEPAGHLGPREKLEPMEPVGSLASLAERAQRGPRDLKETKGALEKEVTQERMEWDSQACLGPQDPQGPWSTCRSRTEQWQAHQGLRAGPASQASLDLLDRRVTQVPEASRASQDPRVRRGSLAVSSALMAEPWALPRKEPRESQASVDPRVRMGGLGTRVRSAFLDGRVALG